MILRKTANSVISAKGLDVSVGKKIFDIPGLIIILSDRYPTRVSA